MERIDPKLRKSLSGISGPVTWVIGLNVSTTNLAYLDHASAPQTQTVVTAVTPTTLSATFTNGMWTS